MAELDTRGHRFFRLFQISLYDLGKLNSALVAASVNVKNNGPAAIKTGLYRGILKTIDDAGNLAELDYGSVLSRHYRNIFKLRPCLGLTLCPEQYLAAPGLDRPCGKVKRRPPYRIRHLGKCKAVFFQIRLRNLY